MSRRKKKKETKGGEQGVSMEMTPMIDVVLQLIIFFMLVMDFSSRDLVPLKLAEAQKAKEEQDQSSETVTVNVAHEDVDCPNYEKAKKDQDEEWKTCRDLNHWYFYMRGNKYYFESGEGNDGLNQLKNDLIAEASKKRSDESPKGVDTNVSEVPLVIRADHRAPWGLVQQVMRLARNKNVNIYKVKLAANIPRQE